MSESEIEPTDLEQYENKRDDLMQGLREAYEAGYKRALEDLEKTDEKFTTDQIDGSEYISECHYYYWDGRTLPLEFWLQKQFGIDQ
jgi:hypothetical protein